MLYNLLKRGYFPSEMPPPFTTEPFAKYIDRKHPRLPGPFVQKRARLSELGRFNLARNGLKRRNLGIVNPLNFYRISNLLTENWHHIDAICQSSHPSITSPIFQPGKSAIHRAFDHQGFQVRQRKRDVLGCGKRYALKADISKCYESIYTHTISWAIDGKARSKRATPAAPSGSGFLIDQEIRDAQDRQSVGVPIGPDTSFIVAESVLSNIDYDLTRIYRKNYFRLMDDYEFFFGSYAECLEAEKNLTEILNNYELRLNEAKTEIVELPFPSQPRWLKKLYDMETDKNKLRFARRALDEAFELRTEYPDEPIIRYTLQLIGEALKEENNWQELQYPLMSLSLYEPGLIPQVIDVIEFHRENSRSRTDVWRFAETAYELMDDAIPRHHLSEISWAIWAHILFSLPLDRSQAQRLADMNCSVVGLLVLDALDQGLIPHGLDTTSLQASMSADDLHGKNWLLAYESEVKGWPRGRASSGYVGTVEGFKELARENVQFYEPLRTRSYVPGFKLNAMKKLARLKAGTSLRYGDR